MLDVQNESLKKLDLGRGAFSSIHFIHQKLVVINAALIMDLTFLVHNKEIKFKIQSYNNTIMCKIM